jgi:alkylation response protein AidB-like acyl-CoA dehydrogenase
LRVGVANDPDTAPGVVEDLRTYLATAVLDDFECEHGDLGYGFGAWSKAFLRELGARGWIGLHWPKESGGQGRRPEELYRFLQELAYAHAPAEALIYTLAVGGGVLRFGTDRLKSDVIPAAVRGEITFAEALTEPDAGSDLFALRSTATHEGSSFVVDGRKIWTSNGWLADYAVVAVRTDRQARGHAGVSTLLVDLRSPGVTRRPLEDLAGDASFAEIEFDKVRVPVEYLLGDENHGLVPILDILEWDRFWARAVKAPYLRRELEDLTAFAQGQHGGSSWDRASIRDTLGGLRAEIEACDALFARLLGPIARGSRRLASQVSLAKVFADRLGQRYYREAADILGPYALIGRASEWAPIDGTIGLRNLASHGLLIAGGTPEMQQTTVASRGLGLGRQAGDRPDPVDDGSEATPPFEDDPLRDVARRFLTNEVTTSQIRRLDATGQSPWAKAYATVGDLGWFGILVRAQFGGAEGSLPNLLAIVEEMGRACLPGPFMLTALIGVNALQRAGTLEHNEEHITNLARGDVLISTSVLGAASSNSPNHNSITAVEQRDGFVLNGVNLFLPHAKSCDLLLIVARARPGSGDQVARLFLVPVDTKGLTIRKMGSTGLDEMCAVNLERAHVSADRLIDDRSPDLVEDLHLLGAIGTSARLTGIAQRALELSVDYASKRKQFGRAISEYQAIQIHCAEMAADVSSSRAITLAAGRSFDTLGGDRRLLASAAKAWAGEASIRVLKRAHRVHGAIGFSREYDLQLLTRMAEDARMTFGNPALHRLLVAARIGY